MREHFVVATAALVVGLESQVPSIYKKQIVPLREVYGFTEDEIEFFDLHITSDVVHGERGYQIVLEHADTPRAAAALPAVRALGRRDALLVHPGALRHLRRARPRGRGRLIGALFPMSRIAGLPRSAHIPRCRALVDHQKGSVVTEDWIAVATTKDLTRRRKQRVEVDGAAIALFHAGGQVYAFDDVCIHQDRSLFKGTLWQGR